MRNRNSACFSETRFGRPKDFHDSLSHMPQHRGAFLHEAHVRRCTCVFVFPPCLPLPELLPAVLRGVVGVAGQAARRNKTPSTQSSGIFASALCSTQPSVGWSNAAGVIVVRDSSTTETSGLRGSIGEFSREGGRSTGRHFSRTQPRAGNCCTLQIVCRYRLCGSRRLASKKGGDGWLLPVPTRWCSSE